MSHIQENRESSSLLAQLRDEFDRSFASIPVAVSEKELFLVIRTTEHRYALRLQEVSAFLPPQPCVSFPTTCAAFEGLLSHRGSLYPSYSLAQYLGDSSPSTQHLWRVILRTSPPVAVSFANVEGLFAVEHQQITESHVFADFEERRTIHRLVWKTIWVIIPGTQEKIYLPVLSVDTLFATIHQDVSSSFPQEKEELP